MNKRKYKIIVIIVAFAVAILICWALIDKLTTGDNKVQNNTKNEKIANNKDKMKDEEATRGAGEKIFNNYTSQDIAKHIQKTQSVLTKNSDDSNQPELEIVEVQKLIDNWVVVQYKYKINPDNVCTSTVLRDNGKALVTKVPPFPTRLGEIYATDNELPEEVSAVLIENSKRNQQ